MFKCREITNSKKYSFLKRNANIKLVIRYNFEERSIYVIKSIIDYINSEKISPKHIEIITLNIVTGEKPSVVDYFKEKYQSELNTILKNIDITETLISVKYNNSNIGEWEQKINWLFDSLKENDLIVFDLSALHRPLFISLAKITWNRLVTKKMLIKNILFAYSWAWDYAKYTIPTLIGNIRSHHSEMSLEEATKETEYLYTCLIANGSGYDTSSAYDTMQSRYDSSSVTHMEDIVFLIHKTAPNNFMNKLLLNQFIYDSKSQDSISYIFSSSEIQRIINERFNEIVRVVPSGSKISLIFIPFGPKLLQFITVFSMNSLIEKLKDKKIEIHFSDIFYLKANSNRGLHSIGVDYSSIIEIKEEKSMFDLIIDGDDTIWYEERFFSELKSELIKLAIENKKDINHVDNYLECTIKKLGFGRNVFIEALAQTAKHFDITDQLLDNCQEQIDKVINFEMVYVDHFNEIILDLIDYFNRIFLYTKGRYDEQIKKVDILGIRSSFDAVYVVQKKDTDELNSIIIKNDININKCVVIGNSLKDDIGPALDLGFKNPIYFNHEHNYRKKEKIENNGYIEKNSWIDIKKLLQIEIFINK